MGATTVTPVTVRGLRPREVSFDGQELMGFFRGEGFRPAPRYCLDLDLDAHRERAAEREAGEGEV